MGVSAVKRAYYMKIFGFISYFLGSLLIIHGGVIGETVINSTGSSFMPYNISTVARIPELLIGGFFFLSGSIFIASAYLKNNVAEIAKADTQKSNRTEPKI